MYIERNKYLKQLISLLNNKMIKIISGIRRCGKSFLLFKIFYNYLKNNAAKDENHIIKLAFDILETGHLRNPLVLSKYINEKIIDDDIYYILLDEMQNVENFEMLLNGLLRIKNVDVYVTDSNARFLSKDIIAEFAGRGYNIQMYPLSFHEFYSAYNGDVEQAFQAYIKYGGLPQLLNSKDETFKEQYIKMS